MSNEATVIARRAGATGPAAPSTRPSRTTRRLRTGTVVYRCFHLDRRRHGRLTDADGTVLLGVPFAARHWIREPWDRFEVESWLEADRACAWLDGQVRTVAEAIGRTDPAAGRRLAGRLAACRASLDCPDSACQVSVTGPSGTLLAWAIVAVWDRSRVHPLLRGMHADPEGNAP